MIRPSALQLAEHCGHAARLAEQYPQGSEYTERGTAIHAEMADALTSGRTPTDPGARRAVEIINGLGLEVIGVEVPVRLEDPEDGTLISEGTCDLALRIPGGVFAIDHKTGLPERVPQPEDALQFHAYGAGMALQHGLSSYRIAAMHIRDGRAWLGRAMDVTGDDFWGYLKRIKRAAMRGPEPIVGAHCSSCFVQSKCYAYMLPAYGGATALEPFTRPDGLTRDNMPQAIQVIEAMKAAIKVADDRIKGFIRQNGPAVDGNMEYGPEMVAGRRSGPSVAECEKRGLGDLVREGQPYERYAWRKCKKS